MLWLVAACLVMVCWPETWLLKVDFRIMEGGADTGFNHVTPEEYRTRLLHFSGKGANVTVKEVSSY